MKSILVFNTYHEARKEVSHLFNILLVIFLCFPGFMFPTSSGFAEPDFKSLGVV